MTAIIDPPDIETLVRDREWMASYAESTQDMFRSKARDSRNRRFAAALSPGLRNDYLSYLRLHVGDPGKVEIADASLVARYCSTANLGLWSDREDNIRLRDRGSKTYRVRRREISDEDIKTMMDHAIITEPAPIPRGEAESRTRFADATRQSQFSLNLGIREIRVLDHRPWTRARWLQPEYVAALQRLIQRGLVVHEPGEAPRLSEAGEHVRKLLVLSKHIVEC